MQDDSLISSFCNKVCSCIGLSDINSSDFRRPFAEPTAHLYYIIRRASKAFLLGTNDVQCAEISQWIYFSLTQLDVPSFLALNNFLSVKSFLVGHSISLADYCVFVAISDAVRDSAHDLDAYSGIKRWIFHIQRFSSEVYVPLPFTSHQTLLPVPSFEVMASGAITQESDAAITSVPAQKNGGTKEIIKTSIDSSKGGGAQCGDNFCSDEDPTRLDIRCGLVLKCWNHPDSDKLLCEEIDLGKESGGVRTIASGIRAHYTADELVGRKVLVLANLKERSMAGFKSQGMVLCAVSADHSAVRLLEVPAETTVGERVLFKGFPVDSVPATPAQMAKKKILEALAPRLRTDSLGVAHWGDVAFFIGGGTVRSSPIVLDGSVSCLSLFEIKRSSLLKASHITLRRMSDLGHIDSIFRSSMHIGNGEDEVDVASAATLPIVNNAKIVQQRIIEAAVRRGTDATSVRLVSVSKTKPVADIQRLYDEGFRYFGENYVQELLDKSKVLPQDISWHFIGHLQSSKASKLVKEIPNLSMIETVDTERLASKLNSACSSAGRRLSVLVQVDTSGEATKSGVDADQLLPLVKHILVDCPCLLFRGLMTIGAPDDTSCFDKLFESRQRVADMMMVDSSSLELSMGMSGDYEAAIDKGATSVRVGSIIFGPRLYPHKS